MAGRKYRLRKRAEGLDAARQRIVDATAALHYEQGVVATSYIQIAAVGLLSRRSGAGGRVGGRSRRRRLSRRQSFGLQRGQRRAENPRQPEARDPLRNRAADNRVRRRRSDQAARSVENSQKQSDNRWPDGAGRHHSLGLPSGSHESEGRRDSLLSRSHGRLQRAEPNGSGATGATPGGNGNKDLDAGTANGFDVGRSDRVVLDHISAAWGMDETLSVTLSRNVTVQNTIIAESLNHSFHPKGAHGYGTLIRGELTPADQEEGTGGYTFYGNLWAFHRARNPSVGGQQRLVPNQPEDARRRARRQPDQ